MSGINRQQDLRKSNVFSSLRAERSNLSLDEIASLHCVSLAMTNHSYDEAQLWLLEDEYEPIEGRLLAAELA